MSTNNVKEPYQGTNYELKTIDVLINSPCSREAIVLNDNARQ